MTDTITAIATPTGEGGISVIRISGPEAWPIASKILRNPSGTFKDIEAQKIFFARAVDPGSEVVLDEVLFAFFRAPKSYTREDVVEINVHGGLYVTSKVLQLLLDKGARLAEPGEFTRRAFLNGRIDLSQAEAVADVIHAASDRALKSALAQLQGRLSGKLQDLYDRLMSVLAHLETAIDFPEEGLEFQQRTRLGEQVSSIKNELDRLLSTYRQGKIVREGARVSLVGKPNVGKSSLLNALLQEDRAIVTPYPGTTRDLLEERIRIQDIHIVIIDSAGLRPDPQPVEQEGIARTRSELAQADLALVLFDGSEPEDANDIALLKEVENKRRIICINKCDLPEKLSTPFIADVPTLKISAKKGIGIDALLQTIHDQVAGFSPESLVITRERHHDLLKKSCSALEKTRTSLTQNISEELVACDLNDALETLGMILGKSFEEDLLDTIFNEFCIGK